MTPFPHCSDGNSGWHQLLLWCHALFLSPLSFSSSLTQQWAQVAFIHLIILSSCSFAMLSLVDKHQHIQAARQNLQLAFRWERGNVPNAMNHQIFGFYAANPCALTCITPHNKLSHLRFPVAGEGFRLRYINVWSPLGKSLFFCKLQMASDLADVATLELTCVVVLSPQL